MALKEESSGHDDIPMTATHQVESPGEPAEFQVLKAGICSLPHEAGSWKRLQEWVRGWKDNPARPCPPVARAKTRQDDLDEWYGRDDAKAGKPPVGPQLEDEGLTEGRQAAEQFAAAVVQRADQGGEGPTDFEVLSCPRLWAFRKNFWRTNVIPEGETYVLSDTLGR